MSESTSQIGHKALWSPSVPTHMSPASGCSVLHVRANPTVPPSGLRGLSSPWQPLLLRRGLGWLGASWGRQARKADSSQDSRQPPLTTLLPPVTQRPTRCATGTGGRSPWTASRCPRGAVTVRSPRGPGVVPGDMASAWAARQCPQPCSVLLPATCPPAQPPQLRVKPGERGAQGALRVWAAWGGHVDPAHRRVHRGHSGEAGDGRSPARRASSTQAWPVGCRSHPVCLARLEPGSCLPASSSSQ